MKWRNKMARPKKTNSEELVSILDAFFSQEAMGDPRKLKCSLLEEYAKKIGKEVKAYDFRRDTQVRKRIEELRKLVQNENGINIGSGASYKNLDINKLMMNRQNPDEFRQVLSELDAYWRYIYEDTVLIRENAEHANIEKRRIEHEYKKLLSEKEKLQEQYNKSISDNKALITENRYLRKMLRIYLYPALANDILGEEHQITNADTDITSQAKKNLIDADFPSSVKAAISEDQNILTREEELLTSMWNSVSETIQ